MEFQLAYTPHPNANPNAQRRSMPAAPLTGAARRSEQSVGLGIAAATALSLFGTAAVLGGPQLSASPSVASEARMFEERAAAPVRPADEPAVVELRPASPMPIVGDVLGDEPAPAPEPVRALGGGRVQRSLTSFNGNRKLYDGPSVEGPPADAIVQNVPATPVYAPAPPRYEPVVWNNPVRWIAIR